MDQNVYRDYLKRAILIRTFEEKLLHLFSLGLVNGTVHTCVGEELTPVIISKYITDKDYFLSHHRGHGHYIAKTGDITGLLAEMLGKKTGVSGGYGGSQHLYNGTFISNGIQGGMTPIAAGIGLAQKLSGSNNIAISFIGDGTLGEGIIYESFNLCGIWKLPVLYVLENNGYAQSTCTKQTLAGDIRKRIEGFGLKYIKTNIWDIDDLERNIQLAIQQTRKSIPTFLEIECYRLNSHSKGDDNRDLAEVALFKKKDLINQFTEAEPQLYSEYLEEAKYLIEFAYSKVFNDEKLVRAVQEYTILEQSYALTNGETSVKIRGNEDIYNALNNEMNVNSKLVFIGEDIANHSSFTKQAYGGAFKVSRDLSDKYPNRVLNTPISESSITGVGIGLSLCGYISIVEIMFGDFMTLTFDQLLQHASKFSTMYGRKISLPLIIRTPMGGRRGYGPTHSQSIEKYFLGIPHLKVLALNNIIPSSHVYEKLFSTIDSPTLVIENKILYTRIGSTSAKHFTMFYSDEIYPTTIYRPDNTVTDITVFCYGGVFEIVKEAVERLIEEDINCEIVCPIQLFPHNIKPLLDSVNKSGKVLFVEEGVNFASLSSELLASLVEISTLKIQARRLGNNSTIPCALEAELDLLPNVDKICCEIKKFLK